MRQVTQKRTAGIERLLIFLACALASARAGAGSGSPMFRYGPDHVGRLDAPAVAASGLAWRFATGGKVRSTPAVAQGMAVFGSEDGYLYAVTLQGGREVWRARIGGDVSSSPAIAGDRVFVMGRDGALRALRLQDGSPVWSCATAADLSLGSDPRLFDYFVSSPAVVGDTIYVGSGDGKLYAVDLSTGKPRWSSATKNRVRSSPAVADGLVYVGSFDGQLYAFDAASGAERWKFQTGDAVQSSPAVSAGTVFFGSRAMATFALDAKTGQLRWRRPQSGSWVLASPAVAEGKVVVGGSDSHRLEALDARNGDVVWSVDTGARVLGSATVVGNVVLYGAEDFRVHTADFANGLGQAMEFTEGPVYGSVVLADGLILAGSDDNHLYAFKALPLALPDDSAPSSLRAAAAGRFTTAAGESYVLSLRSDRLCMEYCHYPPARVFLHADGSFDCPMLFGMRGRLSVEPGKPAAALILAADGQETTARRAN